MNLTIKGLPDAVHARLKKSAKVSCRSLNQEIIAVLSSCRDTLESKHSKSEREHMFRANNKINHIRAKMKRFMTTEEIDAAINQGRR